VKSKRGRKKTFIPMKNPRLIKAKTFCGWADKCEKKKRDNKHESEQAPVSGD